jgi:predicted XRE-type DNA-binding protein
MTPKSYDEAIARSSGNVYADLGFESPAMELARAELARAISRIIDSNGWTQEEAARRMAIDQPKVSAITRGRLAGFSVERLLRLLNALNYSVDVTVRPAGANETAGIGVSLLENSSR